MSQQAWGAPPQQYGQQQGGWGQPQQQYPPQGGNPWGPPPQQQRPPQAQQPQRSANDILMGGGGAPGWDFPQPGTRKVARITKPPQSKQEREYDPRNPGGGKPKFFPSGDPIMGVTVEVQTDERDPADPDDDGKRTFYIEGKRLKEAVREAIRAAGGAGLEVGGTLDVTLTHYDIEGDRKSGRNWQISYTLPGNNVLMGAPTPPQQTQANGFLQSQQLTPEQATGWNGQQAPQGGPTNYQQQTAAQTPPGWDGNQPQQQQGMNPAQQAAFDAWQGGAPPTYDEPPF